MFNRIAGSVATFSLVSTLWFAPPASAQETEVEAQLAIDLRRGRTSVPSYPFADILNASLNTDRFNFDSRTDISRGIGIRLYPYTSLEKGNRHPIGIIPHLSRLGFGGSIDGATQIVTEEFAHPLVNGAARYSSHLFLFNSHLDYVLLEAKYFRLRGQLGLSLIRTVLYLESINPLTGSWQPLDFGGHGTWNWLGTRGFAPEIVFDFGGKASFSVSPFHYTRFTGGMKRISFDVSINLYE